MSIDVNNIIWECSPKVGWKGEKIKINGNGFEVIEAQMEHNRDNENDANHRDFI